VDYFVIVESTHTFVGKEKPLFYNENKHLFENFAKKIIHVIVDDFPHKYPNVNIHNNEVWQNEYFQRNAISRGIHCINGLSNSDIIIISDLDEIPNPHILGKIKTGEILFDIRALEMDLYYYNLNTRFKSKWGLCKTLSYEKYKELNTNCSRIRDTPCPTIVNGGWHLSYFGDSKFIKNKIEQFTHQEYNNDHYTNIEKIEKRVNNFNDLYDRNNHNMKLSIKDNYYLPPEYEKYLSKFIVE